MLAWGALQSGGKRDDGRTGSVRDCADSPAGVPVGALHNAHTRTSCQNAVVESSPWQLPTPGPRQIRTRRFPGIVNVTRFWQTGVMKIQTPSYQRHRFPSEIISHAVWLYHRFCLSFREVEELRFCRK